MSLSFYFEQDVATVFALMTNADFLVERCLKLGEIRADCKVEDLEDKTIVKMARVYEQNLPRFLANIISSVQTTVVEEEWRSSGHDKTGKLIIGFEDQAVTLSANFSLVGTASGCVYTIEHMAKANVSMFAEKVEKFVVRAVGKGVLRELEYTRNILNERMM